MSELGNELGSLSALLPHTPGATGVVETRAVVVSEDCTADLSFPDVGDVDGVPLSRGLNPYRVVKVRAVSAGTVWLGY